MTSTSHALPHLDGGIYLSVKPKNPADVNEYEIVNILDLAQIAQAFGTNKPDADVDRDGLVNILDLVFVANAF